MTGAQAAVLVVAKVLVTDTAAVKEKSPHLSPRCGQDLRKYPLPHIPLSPSPNMETVVCF